MSPIVGLGRKFESVLPFELTYGILGKESIWLIVMTEYGLLGIVAYVFLAIDMVLVIPWRNKNKMLFFMALAYWATSTVSSLPGFCEYLMYLVFFYYIKTGSRYTMSRKKGEWYGIYFHGFKIRYKKREQRRQKSLNTKTENI